MNITEVSEEPFRGEIYFKELFHALTFPVVISNAYT